MNKAKALTGLQTYSNFKSGRPTMCDKIERRCIAKALWDNYAINPIWYGAADGTNMRFGSALVGELHNGK